MGCLFSTLGALLFALILGLLFLNMGHWLVQLTTFSAFVEDWGVTGTVGISVAGFYWYAVLKPLDWLLTGFPLLSEFFGDLTQFPNLNTVMVVAAMLAYPAIILLAGAAIVYVVTEWLGSRRVRWFLPVFAAPLAFWVVAQLGQWLFAAPA